MTWILLLLIGAGCGWVAASTFGLNTGKAVALGAVGAMIGGSLVTFLFKLLFGFVTILLAVVGAVFMLSLLGVGKKT